MARNAGVEFEFDVRIDLVDTSVDGRAVLLYTAEDPLAVTLIPDASADEARCGEGTRWVFSRQLLVYGVATPVGVGDVRVTSASGLTTVHLSSPGGSAQVHLRTDDVIKFVTASSAVVQLGREVVDVPNDISSLNNC